MDATKADLIADAIKRFSSEQKAADAFGVSQPVVNEAKRKGRAGPKLAMGIDRATNGEISKSDLRPDLWPREDSEANDIAGVSQPSTQAAE